MNWWGHRFSKNANQKFEGFMPWKFIRGQSKKPLNFWLVFDIKSYNGIGLLFSKTANHCSDGIFIAFMLRTLYNKIMANYSISLAIYEWIERERATDEDGRQTRAFHLSRCYRPHWVQRFLAVGGPGCCLVKVVLGNLVLVRLFHYSSGWQLFIWVAIIHRGGSYSSGRHYSSGWFGLVTI